MLHNHSRCWAVFAEPLALNWWSICEANLLQTGIMQISIYELLALHRLQVDGHPSKSPRILEVIWRPVGLRSAQMGITFRGLGLVGCAGLFRTYKGRDVKWAVSGMAGQQPWWANSKAGLSPPPPGQNGGGPAHARVTRTQARPGTGLPGLIKKIKNLKSPKKF